jgi:hypothetical protein
MDLVVVWMSLCILGLCSLLTESFWVSMFRSFSLRTSLRFLCLGAFT